MGGFSAPDKDTFKDLGVRYVFWTLFTLLLIASNIIGFNSLIAVIGDSYERVQVDKAFYDAVQKFKVLRELNDNYLFLNRNKEIKADPRFVHIVKYAGDSVHNMEWHGRIQNIKEIVNVSEKSINKKIDAVKSEVAAVNNKIDDVKSEVADVKKRIDSIDEKLQMLINKLN